MGNKSGRQAKLRRQLSDVNEGGARGRRESTAAAGEHKPARQAQPPSKADPQRVERVRELVADTLKAAGHEFLPMAGRMAVAISHQGETKLLLVYLDPRQQVLSFTANVGGAEMNVPAGRRLEVAEFISNVNYGLWHGGLTMDPSDGEVRFEVSAATHLLEDVDALKKVTLHLLGVSTRTFWRVYPGIVDISTGRCGAAEALRRCNLSGSSPAATRPPAADSLRRHFHITCDVCRARDFAGKRYKCMACHDYDLCETCFQSGQTNMRHEVAHEMREYEPAVHRDAWCDACGLKPLVGTRWRCRECRDHDLCQKCHTSGVAVKGHQSSHAMRCLQRPPRGDTSRVVRQSDRAAAGPPGAPGGPPAGGREPGEPAREFVHNAAVRRGLDWKWGSQDGGAGSVGHMLRKGSSPGWVKVEWPGGRSNEYRVGASGKYDLVWAEGAGGGAAARPARAGSSSSGSSGGGMGVSTLVAHVIRQAARASADAGREAAREEVKGVDLEDLGGGIDPALLEVDTRDRSRRIGKGGMGEVYYGLYCGSQVAVKVLPASGQSAAHVKQFVQEVGLHSALRNPAVVQVFGCCKQDDELLLVVELCENKSMADVLHSPRFKDVLDFEMRRRFALDTANGMVFLHAKNVLHLDLKPQNLLVDAALRVKVGDFGLAHSVSTMSRVQGFQAGTPFYMAPEIIKSETAGRAADVYAFGVVLLEVFSGHAPYAELREGGGGGLNTHTFLLRVADGLRPAVPDGTHAGAAALCRRCWHADPKQRPTFVEVQRELRRLQPE